MIAKRKPDPTLLPKDEPMPAGYDVDFYAWANEQGALLRSSNFSAADIENIAEEIESLGRSEKRELVSRLEILLIHLLKWQFQPKKRTKSWHSTIDEQRRRIVEHLKDNPSLKAKLRVAVETAYIFALIGAERQTRLSPKNFPTLCPYNVLQIMDHQFLPE